MKAAFLAVAFAGAVCSCSKENREVGNDGNVTTLSVELGSTRTGISEPLDGKRTVFWNAGDRIALNGIASNPLDDTSEGKSTAQFTWDERLTPPYKVLYPVSFYKSESEITLPFSQNKMPGDDDIATETFPMCGYSETGGGTSLSYLCSILKIQWITGESLNPVTYVEFRGNNGEQVCGDFGINYTTGVLTGKSSDALSRSVRAFSIKTPQDEGDAFVCNIVVPAGTYSGGFTVRLVDSRGNYMDKSTTSSKTFTAGEVKALSPFTFEPSQKIDALCIGSAEEFVAFVQDWNAGRFESGNGNVFLTRDLVFDETTSAALNATGGLGSATNPITGGTNYYNGTISGNGFSIKNLILNVPLVAYTGSAGDVTDLHLDASCKFTYPANGDADWGQFVGRHKGDLIGCSSDADVKVEVLSSSAEKRVGGLVGRVVGGSVEGCAMNGNITLAKGNISLSDKNLYLGGITGMIETDGVVSGSTMAGDIIYEGGTVTAGALYFGGIAGCLRGGGSIKEECLMDGNITIGDATDYGGPSFAAKYIYLGGIVGTANSSDKAVSIMNCSVSGKSTFTAKGTFKTNIGGIVGNLSGVGSLKGCTSSATIVFKSSGARADTTPTYIGGIVGQNGSSSSKGTPLLGCINHGSISTVSNSTTISLGGITGFGYANISDCSNDGAILRQSQKSDGQTNRYVSLGGIIGDCGGGALSNNVNSGEVSSAVAGTATQTTVAMGGVVGKLSNTSGASISSCSNSAKVSDAGGTDVTVIAYRALGGIVGAVLTPSSSITSCTNNGYVVVSYNTKASRCSYVGGILGIAGTFDSSKGWSDAASVSIINCYNYADIYNHNFSNSYELPTASVSGCIAGVVLGSGSGRAKISGCTNTDNASKLLYKTKRGIQGGIAGYVSNTDITSCISTKSTGVYTDNIPRYCGGIVGKMVASTVSSCDADGVALNASSSAACDMGGVAGTMDATSSISSCKVIDAKLSYNASSDNYKWGAIAGTTESGSVIKDCRLSGGWSIDAGSSYTPFTVKNVSSDGNATESGNSLYSNSYNITGTVKDGSTPLAGVVVSDGFQSVRTDSDGKYYLNSNLSKVTCVSVSIPSGYMPAVKKGIPAFWKKLSSLTPVGGVYTVNFACSKMSNPDKFTIIVYADVQIRSNVGWRIWDDTAYHSIDVAKDVFSDIRDRAASVSGNVIGLSLGDQVHKDQSMYSVYMGADMLGGLTFPNFCVPGNHDYDAESTVKTYVQAAANYEANLSPVRYSFNLGRFHVVMLDNARTKYEASEGSEVTEQKGMPDEAWEWLQGDLKHIPTTTPIILCSHSPLFMEVYEDSANNNSRLRDISTRPWALNTEYGALLASYKKVYALNGHLHNTFNYVYPSGAKKNIEVHSVSRATGELWTNHFLNKCGTPRGYIVFDVDGERVTYKFKPVTYQTASLAAGPEKMTYRDYSPKDGKYYMKSTYLSNKGALLDDFYQMHAYVPGTSSVYPNDVIATVFMHDSRWSPVTFEYDGGSVKMSQMEVITDFHDPAYSWLWKWYSTNSGLKDEPNYKNSCPAYNCFRCTPPAGVKAGTVKVTDHFGNQYEYKLQW